MEEILASIRRIISEDDAPAAEAAPEPVAEVAAAPAPEPVVEAATEPEPEPEPVVAEDVLELTQRVEPPKEEVGDLEVYTAPEPEPAPAPALVAVHAEPEEEPLVSEPSAHAAASAFTNFTAAIAMPAAGRTLEDLTRELLRPLLKAWLDENLPRIVESKVAEEVDRISRTRVR